jgi:ABC-type branched-subunit amino acid transport system permease subunit
VKREVIYLSILAALLLALPAVIGPYALSVATLILYFAYTGQAWNVMMGFAGQLSPARCSSTTASARGPGCGSPCCYAWRSAW